ncbi:MAG: nuclear transport factor 2 family protein [Pyrinomonadaceae bacterium]
MTREEAERFAIQWADWWNAGDVGKVLEHFHQDVVFTSPKALEVVGSPSVHGKDALRDYWTAALKRAGTLRFTVDYVLWDQVRGELAIIYISEIGGKAKRVSENLTFDENGQIISAEVFHGVVNSS